MKTYYNIRISDFHKEAKKGAKTFGGTLTFANDSMKYIYSETKNKLFLDEKWLVELMTTPCNYGGVRHWFVCPHCDKAKALLLFNSGMLACSKCFNYKHASLNRTKTDYTYFFRQAEKEAQKIDSKFEWNGWLGDGTFPDRPKNMHHKTYWQIRQKYQSYIIAGHDLFMSRFKLLSSLRR